MRHVGAIAGREVRSLFVSPVAYVVLALFAVIAGFFFFASVLSFDAYVAQLQQFQAFDALREVNLNDNLLSPFYQVLWIVLLVLVPGVTMGLFAAEKANGTEELLLTSPITVWELVIGKFAAAAFFVTLLVGVVGVFTWFLFLYGEPELLKTLAGLLGLLLLGWVYAAIGSFASSVTRNQLIAFFLSWGVMLVLHLLAVVADLGGAGGPIGTGSPLSEAMRYLSSSERLDQLIKGLVDTRDLGYFAFMIGSFLVLTKFTIESVRWR